MRYRRTLPAHAGRYTERNDVPPVLVRQYVASSVRVDVRLRQFRTAADLRKMT